MDIIAPEAIVWPNSRPPESHPDLTVKTLGHSGLVEINLTKPGGATVARLYLTREGALRLIGSLAVDLEKA